MTATLIVVLVLIGGFGVWSVGKSEKAAIRKRFIGRVPISVNEFINMLDLDIGQDCVNNALKELSVMFSIQKELIRPTDRFDIEFAPVKGSEFGSPINSLEFEIASEARAKGIDIKKLDIRTVRDFIVFKCGETL